MSKTRDRLGQIAVGAGALDVIVSGIVPFIFAAKMANQPLSESAKLLAAAMADLSGITKSVGLGLPLLAALLVIVGVGLLSGTSWARKLAITWAGLAIGYLVVMVAVNAVLVWPRIDAAEQLAVQSGATEHMLMGYAAVKYAVVRVALLRLPFPLVVLWCVARRSPAAALPTA